MNDEKYIVRFYDKKDGMWYNITTTSVLKDEAEKIYNDHTFYGKIHSTQQEDLYLQMKVVYQ